MYKAMKAIQRSYFRAPYKAFMVSQKQHTEAYKPAPVPNRVTSMKHTTKASGSQ